MHFVSDQDLATIVASHYDLLPMTKLILVAAAIWLIITILKGYRRNLNQTDRTNANTSQQGEAMVQCGHCGIHLPASESVQSHGQSFCCEAHARLSQDERQG